MRRWFLVLLTLLVAAQLSWAGAAMCCVDELAGQGEAQLFGSEQAHKAQASDAHPVCETGHCHCHHAGCATPLDGAPHPAPQQSGATASVDAAHMKSHTPAGLDRPNWQRA